MTVYFRGKPTCTCMAKWVPAFERELRRRGLLKGNLVIYQLIGSAAASAGTHGPPGGAIDCQPLSRKALKVARQMGCGMWHRRASQGPWIAHSHGILNCPHNRNGRYQIAALAAGFNGLGAGGRGARDDGPPPRKLRTYRAGITWAKKNQKKTVKKESIMKLARPKRTHKGAQKLKPGKWVTLKTEPTPASKANHISNTIGSDHGNNWTDIVHEYQINHLSEGGRVCLQAYKKNDKSGKVNRYKKRDVHGSEAMTGSDGVKYIRGEVRWFRKPGKNARTRLRVWTDEPGVTVSHLTSYGII